MTSTFINWAGGFNGHVGGQFGGVINWDGGFDGFDSGPLLSIPSPTPYSTVANPLAGKTGDWAIGITVTPTVLSSHKPPASGTGAAEICVAAGVLTAADTWCLFLGLGDAMTVEMTVGSGVFQLNSGQGGGLTVGSVLTGLQPGARNLVMAVQGGTLTLDIDGVTVLSQAGVQDVVQPASFDFGQLIDTTFRMTHWTLSNFKLDRSKAKVSTASGSGPGALPQGALWGDSLTIGATLGTNAPGSWGEQFIDARKATQFWWMPAKSGALVAYATAEYDAWGAGAGLTRHCFLIGVNNLAGGASSGAATFAALSPTLDAIRATSPTKVVLCAVTPFDSSSAGGGTTNTERLAYNTLLSNYCTTWAGANFVYADLSTLLWDPAAHENLNPTYDSGDHLHWNQAGHDLVLPFIAALV